MKPLRALIFQTAGILVLTVIGAIGTYHYHPKRPALYLSPAKPAATNDSQVSTKEALEWKTHLVWVDARDAAAYQAAHIPNAISLNTANLDRGLAQHLDLMIDQRRRFVIYTEDGTLTPSAQAVAEKLRSFGKGHVYFLEGGWKSWGN